MTDHAGLSGVSLFRENKISSKLQLWTEQDCFREAKTSKNERPRAIVRSRYNSSFHRKSFIIFHFRIFSITVNGKSGEIIPSKSDFDTFPPISTASPLFFATLFEKKKNNKTNPAIRVIYGRE